MYVGVTVIIGSRGVERIVEISLSKTEMLLFQKEVSAVKNLVALVRKLQRRKTSTRS